MTSNAKRNAPVSDGLYRLLLNAYPGDFRSRFGAEMEQVFRDCRRAEARRGRGALLGLWFRALADFAASVPEVYMQTLFRSRLQGFGPHPAVLVMLTLAAALAVHYLLWGMIFQLMYIPADIAAATHAPISATFLTLMVTTVGAVLLCMVLAILNCRRMLRLRERSAARYPLRRKVILFAPLAILLVASAATAGADVSGTWHCTATEKSGQRHQFRLDLVQKGSEVTGTAAEVGGESIPIRSGKFENGKLTFEVHPQHGVIRVEGKLDSAKLAGTIHHPEVGPHPWEGRR